MKILTVITCLLLTNLSSAEEPQIINDGTKKEVLLGAEAEKALKAWDPIFKVYQIDNFAPTVRDLYNKDLKNELPMAVIADFNADKKNDLALLGTNKMKELTIILLADKKGYKILQVKSASYKKPSASTIPVGDQGVEETGLGFYIGLAKGADLKFKSNSATSVRDGLQTEVYGGETKVYYLDSKQKIVEYKGLIP